MAGLIGGLAGAWTMNQFQSLLSKLSEKGRGAPEEKPAEAQAGQQQSSQEDGDATVKAANKIAQRVLHRELRRKEKRVAGPAVHYVFGATVGALYGVAAEAIPASHKGLGLPFGTVLWATADEAAVPLLGLSKSPREYPVTSHLSALAAHLVYGLTTDVVRRAARRIV